MRRSAGPESGNAAASHGKKWICRVRVCARTYVCTSSSDPFVPDGFSTAALFMVAPRGGGIPSGIPSSMRPPRAKGPIHDPAFNAANQHRTNHPMGREGDSHHTLEPETAWCDPTGRMNGWWSWIARSGEHVMLSACRAVWPSGQFTTSSRSFQSPAQTTI